MSSTRSISSRNIFGAFLGGVFGILTLGLITPWLLPVGCLLGVVLGFWYDVLWHDFHARDAGGARLITVKTLQLFGWYALPRSKQVSYLQRAAITAYYLVALPLWMKMTSWSWTHLPIEQIQTGRDVAHVALPLALVCLALFGPLLVGFFVLFEPLSLTGRRTRVRQWRRLQRQGIFRFMLFCCLGQLRNAVANSLMVALYKGLVSLLALAVFTCTAIPTALFVGGLRLADAFAVRWQYLLCLGTTLTLTIVTAVHFRGQLHGQSLWLAALATGCVSGLAAEGLRRTMAALLSRLPESLAQLRDGNLESLIERIEDRNTAWREAAFRPMVRTLSALQVRF